MINIYPSKLEGAPLETHVLKQPETIHDWLRSTVPSFSEREVHPISVWVNNRMIGSANWATTTISPNDTVDIYVEPGYGIDWVGWVTIAMFVMSAASMVYSLVAMGNMPKLSTGAPVKGDALDEATARGNKVRLNSIIREIAGTFKVYPDYLLPPHTYFDYDSDQWIEMTLCVGKGSYTIPEESVLVGDTQFIAITEDVEYAIYEPGEDLSADTAARWWHSATEVAGTSTGKAGLELNATYVIGTAATAESYTFDGLVIMIPEGAGEWPAWPVESVITIEQFLDYTVTDGGSDRDIISGDFTTLAPFAGMIIEITGENEGDYVINETDGSGYITLDYDNGSPVNGFLTGTRRMAIGYRNQQYEITAMITNEYDFNSDFNPTRVVRDEMHVIRLTDDGTYESEWLGFALITTNDPVIAIDASGQEGEWAGPFAACPDGEVTSTLEYDLMFPSGLGKVAASGVINPVTVQTEIQYREIGTTEWLSVIKTMTAATLDQLGYTESFGLGDPYRPEVRMRRVGAKSTLTDTQDTVQWYGLKSRLTAPSSYAGVTTMTVKLRGGDRISAQSDQLISVQATRKLPTLVDGAWTDNAETRSIVPWVSYIAKSMGYTDDDLSLVDFETLGAVWDARGDYFDMSVESEGTVKGEMLNALRAGFAELTLDRGVIKPIRDQIRTVYEHMYTPQNMAEQLTRSFQTIRPDEFDEVDVEYIDGTTWAKETVECRLDGDNGAKSEKITLEGVTDRTRAWRIGMRQRRMQKYRRKTYKFATELDALNSSYMSFCALGDDVPGYSQSSILMGYTALSGAIQLQSSEPFVWADGVDHVIGIRKPDGTLSGPYSATRVSDYVISIPELDFTPDTTWAVEPPHLIFGTVTRWSYPVLISSISHNGQNKVEVEAVNYDARIYDDDDNTP